MDWCYENKQHLDLLNSNGPQQCNLIWTMHVGT